MSGLRDELSLGETAIVSAEPRARAMHDLDALELVPGQMFRGLRIRSLLGAGAMGNAYLASHHNLRVPVVVKLFRVAGKDPLAEAHLAARVVSPHVVPVLDAGVEGDVPYVVQRYVDGIDLEELLGIHAASNRTIPVATLVRIAIDVFKGLSAIHIAGVVHRDIKPPNLFLAGSGEALVGDFGIAVDPSSAHRPEVAGTPMFIAPELWDGKAATPRTDLYSAAATLHLLWQQRPPFSAATLLEFARLHRELPYAAPTTHDPVGAYLGAVLGQLLRKEPCDRPESALGTARMLERVDSPQPELRGHDAGRARVGDVSVQIEMANIGDAKTDVIVNGANEQLDLRSGVGTALRKVAGDGLEAEAQKHGPITMGQVIWTAPYGLHCQAVAHAAAAFDGAICIQRAVLRTLFEAERRGYRSITFPALGTGAGGVPHGFGARLLLEAIRTFSAFGPRHLRSITVALVDGEAYAAWNTALVALDADAVLA